MKAKSTNIRQLLKNPRNVSRDVLASRVTQAFSAGEFTTSESAIAIEIFRLLLLDAEKSIRKTLADNLCASSDVPRDIVLKLANDENEVAERILQYSTVLTDDDLVEIIKSSKEVLKLCAIARRGVISERVSDKLLGAREEKVLVALFDNKNAKLGENGLERSWDLIAPSAKLLEALVRHGNLPLTIMERTFSLVSDELKRHLAREYKLTSPVIQKYLADAREWELLGISPVGEVVHPDDDARVEDLVEQLAMTGRLTHSLVIRSLCMGCLNLFEMSIARMADVPRVNARILLMSGKNSFEALYKSANMPDGFAEAAQKLLVIALELSKYGYAKSNFKPDDFRKSVIREIHIAGYNRTVSGMSYLLLIIDGKITQNTANLHIENSLR
jgi:uncharacterized protein (DUF2336 family)